MLFLELFDDVTVLVVPLCYLKASKHAVRSNVVRGLSSMGSPTVKITLPDGTVKETTAEDVTFKATEEPWTIFQLEDGSKLRVRPVVMRVQRTAEFDNEGNPIYRLAIGTVVFTDSPESLKRR